MYFGTNRSVVWKNLTESTAPDGPRASGKDDSTAATSGATRAAVDTPAAPDDAAVMGRGSSSWGDRINGFADGIVDLLLRAYRGLNRNAPGTAARENQRDA